MKNIKGSVKYYYKIKKYTKSNTFLEKSNKLFI